MMRTAGPRSSLLPPSMGCLKRNSMSRLWLAFLDKTNVTVVALTACVVLYTRSAGVAYFAVGAVACSLSVKAVKMVIRQPRPPNLPRGKLKTSYGMPSTHSASISYFMTYILLACAYLPMHPSFQPGLTLRVIAPLLTFPWGVSVVMSRVWLGHHTWPQVFAGASYGVVLASVWFALWINGLHMSGKEAENLVNVWIHGI